MRGPNARRAVEFAGRPHAEIAREMGREPGAVRMLLQRAKVKLAMRMRELLGE